MVRRAKLAAETSEPLNGKVSLYVPPSKREREREREIGRTAGQVSVRQVESRDEVDLPTYLRLEEQCARGKLQRSSRHRQPANMCNSCPSQSDCKTGSGSSLFLFCGAILIFFWRATRIVRAGNESRFAAEKESLGFSLAWRQLASCCRRRRR